MSSGYDDRDDRRDDRDDGYDDRPRRRDRDDDDRPRRRGGAAAGREKVQVPAILLIVVGGLGLAMTGLSLVQVGQLPAQLDQATADQAKQVDANPNLTDDQKKQQKQMMADIMDAVKKGALPVYLVNLLVSAVITFGGVQMYRLAGRGWPITASLLAALPCVNSFCCVVGLPVGIWALIVLSKPEVKAAFGAARRPADRDYE